MLFKLSSFVALISALLLATVTDDTALAQSAPPNFDPTHVAWYQQGANRFVEALPLGNGRLGMMAYGGTQEEVIVLNEESMWSGSPNDDNRSDAHQNLPQIRQLLLDGKNPEAEALVNQTFTCQGKGSGHGNGANVPFGCYQTLGQLKLLFEGDASAARDYCRWLDLRTATAGVQYGLGDAMFRREYFVSAADQVGVMRLTAERGGMLSFSVALDRPERSSVEAIGNDQLLMTGQLSDGRGGGGVRYAARVRVISHGGEVTVTGTRLNVREADEVIILFAGETDYHGSVPRERRLEDPVEKTREVLAAAEKQPYSQLLSRHVADHRQYYDRVAITLENDDPASATNAQLPTDKRLESFQQLPCDPALAALYFNFGRYLIVSSSRPGTLPSNLQGIWAEEIQTPWNGDWHLDINVQMNYWPAEVCNLSDCHQPMLQLIQSLQEPGHRTAQAYYDADGWVAHVITNCWGFTAPGELASWGSTVSGSAWLCQHLWEHYAYTRDMDYLRWAYPILKGSSQFYLSMLIEEPKHGWLVTAPSNSPENTFRISDGRVAHTCMGPTVDMQILRELFGNCIQASEILGIDASFRTELTARRARLAPNQIGPDGRLQEWLEPYEEPEPQHRHISHMYGLHPYYEITPEGTPELAAAARDSLLRRGFQGDVGWSNAWKANLWARLFDEEHAAWYLHRLIGQNTFPGLFDACWPGRVFQIDGNFGGTSAIAEMLLQSHPCSPQAHAPAVIHLLPALPKAWARGSITGLCARGGYELDIQWDAGKLKRVVLAGRSNDQPECTVRYRNAVKTIKVPKGKSIVLDGALEEVSP